MTAATITHTKSTENVLTINKSQRSYYNGEKKMWYAKEKFLCKYLCKTIDNHLVKVGRIRTGKQKENVLTEILFPLGLIAK